MADTPNHHKSPFNYSTKQLLTKPRYFLAVSNIFTTFVPEMTCRRERVRSLLFFYAEQGNYTNN